MNQDELWKQLGHATTIVASRGQVLWTQSSVFWAANAVLLVALFQGGEPPKKDVVGFLISATALGLTIVWRLLQDRMIGLLKCDEELLTTIQKHLNIEDQLIVSRKPEIGGARALGRRTFPAKRVLQVATDACALWWFISMCIFLIAGSRNCG